MSFTFLSTRQIYLSLLLIGLLVYGNSVDNPFVHDDLVFIRHNPDIARLDHWPTFFLRTSVPVPGIQIANPYYRPLLDLVYRLQYRMFGFHVMGYHLFNISLHVMNAGLVFLILSFGLKAVGNRFKSFESPHRGLSWWTALIFLIHPVQSEAVACIAGVSNLIFACLTLLSVYMYIRLRTIDLSARQRTLSLVSAYGFYVLALLTKEQAIYVPAFLLALEIGWCLWQFHSMPEVITPLTAADKRPYNWSDGNQRRAWRFLGGFVILTLIYLLWRKIVFGQVTTIIGNDFGELLLRLKAIPKTLLIYCRILVFPYDLHYMRSLDVLRPSIGSWFGCFLGVVLIWQLIKRMPPYQATVAMVGWAWFLITLAPVLNVIPLIHEYSWIAIFEHFVYLPSVGFFLFVFITGEFYWRRFFKIHSRRLGLVSTALVVIVLGGWTIRQNTFWRNEIVLFERAVRYEPDLGRLRLLLGKAYYFAGKNTKASRQLSTALTIMQDYFTKTRFNKARSFYEYFLKEIYFVLGHVRERQGDYRDALEMYRRALIYGLRDTRLHNNIGVNLIRLNEYERAMVHFRAAIQLNPLDIAAINNLAICLIETGQRDEARRLLEQAVRLNGDYVPARQNLRRLEQRKAGVP